MSQEVIEMIADEVFGEMQAMNEETCWRAISTRDVRFNGTLVYGVRSTKIFCKPSCPSRRPRREQVVFFQSFKAAERAGFRACRRCLPRTLSNSDPQVSMV